MYTDEDFELLPEEEKAALRAGASSWPDRKMQRWGLPCQWREAGPFDWTGCDAVEVVARRLNGVPVLVNTRMPADRVLQNFEWGETPEDIAYQFDLDIEAVRTVLSFAGALVRKTVAA